MVVASQDYGDDAHPGDPGFLGDHSAEIKEPQAGTRGDQEKDEEKTGKPRGREDHTEDYQHLRERKRKKEERKSGMEGGQEKPGGKTIF